MLKSYNYNDLQYWILRTRKTNDISNITHSIKIKGKFKHNNENELRIESAIVHNISLDLSASRVLLSSHLQVF